MKALGWALVILVGAGVLTIIAGMWPVYAHPARGAVCGTASWYGPESGSVTASGEKFRPDGMTAAMPSRSMIGRTVRVTDQRTGRSIVVLVNDLGPAARLHRVIDLARGAARSLGMGGLAQVCAEIVR